MTEQKYTDDVERVVKQFDPAGENRYFLFGSAVGKKKFRDIDLGVVGNSRARKNLSVLRESFYDSRIPYAVDVVDFDEADREFRAHVLHDEKIVWIR